MSDTAAPDGKKPDLETQIREAEQRVIAADRDWRQHNDALAEAVRGKAGRAAQAGSKGLAVAAVGVLATIALRWRLGAKAKRQQDRFFAQTVAKLRQAPQARRTVNIVPPAVEKAPRWHAVVALLGTLLGAAATSSLGLKRGSAKGGGIGSMLVGVAMPLLTRWLRSRGGPGR